MKATGQDRVKLGDAGLHLSGHRGGLSLTILDVQALALSLGCSRFPYGGTLGLLTIPRRLRVRPLDRSLCLLLEAQPVGAFTL
jgi:hypothetical protein